MQITCILVTILSPLSAKQRISCQSVWCSCDGLNFFFHTEMAGLTFDFFRLRHLTCVYLSLALLTYSCEEQIHIT